MRLTHVSLDQWQALIAVVDCGGYAQAAATLHRSQSSISYAIGKLQDQLGITVLAVRGRKAYLTEAGEVLLSRARQVLADAQALESLAHQMRQGWEAEIRLVVDAAFPSEILVEALKAFAPQGHGTRVLLDEVVLSGAIEALQSGNADLVIGNELSTGYITDRLIDIDFIAVAHPEHPLHQLDRILTMRDLQKQMQVVIKDSGQAAPQDFGWLGAEQRWTVSSINKAITTISAGLGYGWLPQHRIDELLTRKQLKRLPLKTGQSYRATLFMTYGKELPGEATALLGRLIRENVERFTR